MAYDPNPASWIPSWTSNGTLISIPIASFPLLSASEAQANSGGDVRKTWYALIDKMYSAYSSLPIADQPKKMMIYKSTSVNTSDTTSVATHSYSFQFLTTTNFGDVVAE